MDVKQQRGKTQSCSTVVIAECLAVSASHDDSNSFHSHPLLNNSTTLANLSLDFYEILFHLNMDNSYDRRSQLLPAALTLAIVPTHNRQHLSCDDWLEPRWENFLFGGQHIILECVLRVDIQFVWFACFLPIPPYSQMIQLIIAIYITRQLQPPLQ